MAARTITVGGADFATHLADTADAHDASAISVAAPDGTGNLTTAVTDVQALVSEVDALVLGETEVFRSDYYISSPLSEYPPAAIVAGVLTFDPLAGGPWPMRVMLDDPGLGSDRGIWTLNEDSLNPGTNDGTGVYAPVDEQPYQDGNSGRIGVFGVDPLEAAPAIGSVVKTDGGSWTFYRTTYYSAETGTDWPSGDPVNISQGLNKLARGTTLPITLAELVNTATASELTPRRLYFVTDVGGGMVALASDVDTYAFLGTLALDHDDDVPTGYIGHFTRTPPP